MAVLNLNDLKQVFREEEQEREKTQQELARLKAETTKAQQELARERHELNKQKTEYQRQTQQQKIALLEAKEHRVQELHEQRIKQAQKQQKTDNITYIISIGITFLSVFTSFILFMTILLKG